MEYVAVYDQFRVDKEGPYRLSISGFDTQQSTVQDSLTWANGMAFSTTDNDNDISSANCAEKYMGAWWYTKCHSSNLNGYNYNRGDLPETPEFYAKGIIWKNHENVPDQEHYFSWPSAKMKIRRKL